MKAIETTKENENRKALVKVIFGDILGIRANTSNMGLFNKLLVESGLNRDDLCAYAENNKEEIIKYLSDKDCSINTKLISIFALFRNTLGKVTYAGCYEIVNKKTNEVYIGESIDLFRRFTKHTSDLYENKHHCVKLQEAFNLVRTMDEFVIRPIKVNPIVCADKMKVKEETLYMESAYYLMYKKEGRILYNTVNPYEALKNDNVSIGNNKVNCKNVLTILYQDKCNILDNEILEFVRDDLKDIVDVSDIVEVKKTIKRKSRKKDVPVEIQNSIDEINLLKEQGKKFYSLTNVYDKMVKQEIIPQRYDSQKIKEVLVKNNIIELQEHNGTKRTFATDYSLTERLIYIKGKYTEKDGFVGYRYLISEKGLEYISDIMRNYPNKNELEYVNLDETA